MANTNSVLYQVGQAVKAGLSSAQIDGVTSLSTPDGYNIGIGTTSPVRTLDVKGTFVISNSASSYWGFDRDDSNGSLRIDDSGVERMCIDIAGNVGIGTTNPGAKLDIFGSNSSLKFTRDAGDRSAEMVYDGGKFLIKAPTGDRLSITDASSNELLTINPNNGNVGIGTTSPSTNLEVLTSGSEYSETAGISTYGITINDPVQSSLNLYHGGVGSALSRIVGLRSSPSNSELAFITQNSAVGRTEKMRINSDGNVGIGTTNPDYYKLDVNSTGVPVRLTAPGNSGMELWNAVATGWEGFIGTESGGNGLRYNSRSGNHAFYNNSVKAVEIDSSGNLDITGQYLQNGSPISTGGGGGGSANIDWGTTPGAYAYSGIDAFGLFIEQVDDNTGKGKIRLQTRQNNSGGYTQFYINGDDNKFTFVGGGDVEIQGNLAIGAAVAYEKLAVNGNVHAYGTDPHYYLGPDANARDIGFKRVGTAELAIIRFNSGWYESMRINSDGNVGIGTTNPGGKLTVAGDMYLGTYNSPVSTSNKMYYIKSSPFAWPTAANNEIASIGMGAESNGSDDGVITFNTAQNVNTTRVENEVMRITSGGNVGIGTTNPLAALAVQDSNHGGSIQLGSSSGANQYQYINFANNWQIGKNNSTANTIGSAGSLYIYNIDQSKTNLCIDTTGNVGIGTTSPNKTLEVAGNIRATKTSVDGGVIALGLNTGGSADHPTLDVYDKDGNDGARITANGNSWLSAKTGNVGIGTTNPNGTLTVRNDSSSTVQLILGNTTNTGGRDWRLGRDNVSTGDFTISYSDVTNNNTTTEAMRIDRFGNVGIGTTNPASNLHVKSSPQTSSEIRCGDEDQQQFSWLGLMTDSGNTQIWHGGSNYSGWGGAYNTSIYNSNGDFTFHPQAQANKVVINNVGLGINTGASGPVTELQIKGSSSGMGIEMGYSPSADQMFIQSYNRATARYANLLINPGSATNGATTQVGQKIQLTGDGQGRFGGWYGANNGGFRDAALEVGVSSGNGWILPYDRNANMYLPQLNLQCALSKISMRYEGSTHITGTLSVPSNPHYSFRRLSHVTSNGNIGSWDSPYNQTGSDFNSITGVFTAPITGKYLFTITGLMYGIVTSNSSNTWLQVNGISTFFMGQYSAHTGSYNGFSGSHAVWLNANDYANYYHSFISGGLHSSYLNMSITYIS